MTKEQNVVRDIQNLGFEISDDTKEEEKKLNKMLKSKDKNEFLIKEQEWIVDSGYAIASLILRVNTIEKAVNTYAELVDIYEDLPNAKTPKANIYRNHYNYAINEIEHIFYKYDFDYAPYYTYTPYKELKSRIQKSLKGHKTTPKKSTVPKVNFRKML